MKKIHSRFFLSCYLIFALMLLSQASSAIVIDDFNGDEFAETAPISAADAGVSSGGFARTVDAISTSGTLIVRLNVALIGRYSHSGGVPETFGISTVHYALGDLDLTVDADALSIDIFGSTDGTILSISLEDVTGQSVSSSQILPTLSPFGPLTPFTYSFAGFAGDPGFDFTHVALASINVDSTVAGGSTYSDNFQTVCIDCVPPIGSAPEPATLILLALGLAGMGHQRRRTE